MADLRIDWMKPIKLLQDGWHSLTINAESIPEAPGADMFLRCIGKNTTEVVYVGKAANLKKPANWHRNNHALITSLIDKEGVYYLTPGKFKALSGHVAKKVTSKK